MLLAALDPALLAPPGLDDNVDPRDWVLQTRAWTQLLTDAAVDVSCPSELNELALAAWWHRRDEIVSLVSHGGGPFAHADLLLVLEELRGRLAPSPLADGADVLLANVSLAPDYVYGLFGQTERELFKEHLGELAYRRRQTTHAALVITTPASWSADPHIIELQADVEMWETGETLGEADGDGDTGGLREDLTGCLAVADACRALLGHPGALLEHPRLALRAFAVATLGVDPAALRFTVAEGFVASVRAMGYERDAGRARTCIRAMTLIASGRAGEITGLNAHAVHVGDDGTGPTLRDHRGRTLQRGYLARHSPDAHRLHWWNGETPEFVAVGGHDDPIPVKPG